MHIPLSNIQITATDIDKHILSQAKNGIYSAKSIASVPEEFRQKYFKEFGNNSFQISNDIKSRVEFREHNLLKEDGIIYTSFKYSEFEGERNGRYFTDFTIDSFKDFIQDMDKLTIVEYWITGDVRPGRGEEKWLNLILQKI